MFGAAPATYTGDSAWRFVVPTNRLPENLLGRVHVGVHGAARPCRLFCLREGTLLNLVGCVETEEMSERVIGPSSGRGPSSRPISRAGTLSFEPSSMLRTRISAVSGRCSTVRQSTIGAADASALLGELGPSDLAVSCAGRRDGDRGRWRGARRGALGMTVPDARRRLQTHSAAIEAKRNCERSCCR